MTSAVEDTDVLNGTPRRDPSLQTRVEACGPSEGDTVLKRSRVPFAPIDGRPPGIVEPIAELGRGGNTPSERPIGKADEMAMLA